MMQVLKYSLTYSFGNPITFGMWGDAIPLCVHTQGDATCLWVLSETSPEKSSVKFRTFVTYSTGFKFEDSFDFEHKYIGTVFIGDAVEVYHVFELIKRKEGQ